ncbi:MAG: lysophospholipid acyltransferase family protein [bacterium]
MSGIKLSSVLPGRYLAEYMAYLALKSLLCIAPFGATMRHSDSIGRWIFHGLGIRNEVALANLKYAFGDSYNGEPVETIADRFSAHLFKTILELANIRKVIKHMDDYVELRNLDRLKNALRKGKGVLLPSGHFGNFELGALALAWKGLPVSVLIKHMRNPFIDRDLTNIRQSLGTEVLDIDYAGRGILGSLKRNRIVCILGDQDVGLMRGTIVDFFGHPTSTPTGTARMAIQTGAPILPCFIYRKENGTHVLDVEPALEVDCSRNMREKEIKRITQEISLILERWVSAHPEQYFWVHRRWKSTDEGKLLYQKKI